MHRTKFLSPGTCKGCLSPDWVFAAAVAKPALLLALEQASIQDAPLARFMSQKPVTKIVIIIHKLLTSAFQSILHALKVSHAAAYEDIHSIL